MVTSLLQVLEYRPAARRLEHLLQQSLHFDPIHATRRRANSLVQLPAAGCQFYPTNSSRVGRGIPPGVLVTSAVAVEQKPPGSLVRDDDEATIVLLLESGERHSWSPKQY
jgi:hypothetical protein